MSHCREIYIHKYWRLMMLMVTPALRIPDTFLQMQITALSIHCILTNGLCAQGCFPAYFSWVVGNTYADFSTNLVCSSWLTST